jgi:hypothetical protein
MTIVEQFFEGWTTSLDSDDLSAPANQLLSTP